MSTLLLRLAGPMQSWGTQSRFSVRDSDLEPSFSGVVGLVCAALGRGRAEQVDDLAELRMGVRVDREGRRSVDYHTAGGTHRRGERYGVYKANRGAPDTVVSYRHYLADAEFLVALEGPRDVLERIDHALARPVWPLSLGRRSFPPSLPVRVPDSLSDGPLEAVLRARPWRRRLPDEPTPDQLRLVLPAAPGDASEVRMDVPLSFADGERAFASRSIRTAWMPAPEVT
jgi:CRISPR system Cascade subunit CasD